MGFLGGSVVKNPPANAGDTGLIPGSGRSPGEENGNPLQYSCLGNSMDRGPLRATVHGVPELYIIQELSNNNIYKHTHFFIALVLSCFVDTMCCVLFCFINGRFVVALCGTRLLEPCFQQYLLTLCLCHIVALLAIFQTLYQQK